MLRSIDQGGPTKSDRKGPDGGRPFVGPGIRGSLLLGFGAMCAVMVLATATAIFGTATVSESIGVILDRRLPATIHSLRVARATDALTAAGAPLASITTEAERRVAFERVDGAQELLRQALDRFGESAVGTNDIRLHADGLTENLVRLRRMVDQRVKTVRDLQMARQRLLTNLQSFKQQLTYRVRILESDGDVIGRLVARPSPPMDRIAEMVRTSIHLIPVARFDTEVEMIAGRVLAAIQDPTLTALAVSRQVLEMTLDEAASTFGRLPPQIASSIAMYFAELRDMVLADNGLVALREEELSLQVESQNLIEENRRITRLIDAATSELVSSGLEAMADAGQVANKARQRYSLILGVVTGLGLLGIAALMYFHVMRNVIVRLSRLSEAMRDVAAGRLDTPLPPTGNDELGRLGYAMRQFLTTALEADRREAELRVSNQQLENAWAELEQKARELKTANHKLADLAVSDFLTGLANRRRFDDVLASEWARARRGGLPLALIMIDVDRFKPFNDGYGHQAGDACLRRVASVLGDSVTRAGDLVARYGGEEFGVILAEASLDGARVVAEKIRQSIAALALTHEYAESGVVTVSAGVASVVPDEHKTASDLIRMADTALYAAKAGGRNCTRVFDDDQASAKVWNAS